MKKLHLISLAALVLLAGSCDVKPAKEFIEDTGAVAFTASFQSANGVEAPWSSSDKLLVIDSDNVAHRFGLDTGAGSSDGEFSGDVTPKTTVKYVVYANNINQVEFDPTGDTFKIVIPSEYKAKEANTLLVSNNAAIGILSGSEVNLQSLCGFVKFTVEPNGKTLSKGGKTYDLTDIKTVSFTSNDGKVLSGTVNSTWNKAEDKPAFDSVENGSNTITFSTQTMLDGDGAVHYVAGDYYIPVVPQPYEDIDIRLEDYLGRTAVNQSHRSLSVQQAVLSNLSALSWPSIKVSVNLYSNTTEEDNSHPVKKFPSQNLSADRYEISNPSNKVAGQAKQRTEVTFTENTEIGPVTYTVWSTGGYYNYSGSHLQQLGFNRYAASWSYQEKTWCVGYTDGVAWMKIPGYHGVLSKVEVNMCCESKGPFTISTSVDPETGLATNPITTVALDNTNTPKVYTFAIPDAEMDQDYYFCMGPGYGYRLQSWAFYYKVYD